MALWLLALSALLMALLAFAHARRTARKLAMLEEMYWQLKFEHGELKAKGGSAPESAPNFVPLTRLRPPPPKAAAGQAQGEAGSLKQ